MTLAQSLRHLCLPGVTAEALDAAIAMADALPELPHAVLVDPGEITFEWTAPDRRRRVSYHWDDRAEPTITCLWTEGGRIMGAVA